MTTDEATEATYAWIITKDHMPDPDHQEGTYSNATGIVGPRNAPALLLMSVKAGLGTPFRIYDDDGELYYSGVIMLEEDDPFKPRKYDNLDDRHFAPLTDFGAPNAGATEIRYKKEVWVTL